jgi:Pyruvate/2-oxoacid:ferredoxin oxidoreductase delta subunit
MRKKKPAPSASKSSRGGQTPENVPPVLDRADPLRILLMSSYMRRVMDVLDFYEVVTRVVTIPIIGKYFFMPIVNLYGAKYHSGRAMPLRDVVPALKQSDSVVVSECACRVRLNNCNHSTRTCLKINSGAETELKVGDLRSERIDIDEAIRIVEKAYDDGLMLNVEWCIDPYTYSICCCCACCCVQRKLRFERGVKSGVMNSRWLPRFDPDSCADCGKCEELCPGKAISVVDGKREVDESNCVGCGLCEHHCGSGSIQLVAARPAAFSKERGFFYNFLIYLSCYFVLAPYFIVYMLLKGKKRERARDIEW